MPRILVISIRAIGDVVLMTPILALLKKAFPQSYLAVLVDGSTAEVLFHNPSVDRLIRIDRSALKTQGGWKQGSHWIHLIRDLQQEQFDLAVDLFSGSRSALLTFFSKAPKRYGEDFRAHGRGYLYNFPIKILRDGKHLIEQKVELLNALLGEGELKAGPLEVFVTDSEKEQAQQLLTRKTRRGITRVGLIPSAGSNWRIWPLERYAELANILVHTIGVEIVLLGGEGDRATCRAVSERMQVKPLDLSGKTTLRELIAVLGELDLVIANVTGPMHVAVALPKPKVIGLYGAADTIQYAPWGMNAKMLTKGTTRDAYWNRVDYRKDYEVLCQITVDDVLESVRSTMLD